MIPFVVGATGDLQIDRLVFPRCGFDQFQDNRFPAVGAQWIGQLDPVQSRLQSKDVLVNAKSPARIDRDQFIDTVAIQKTAIQRRNTRFRQRQEATIQKDRVGDVGRHELN